MARKETPLGANIGRNAEIPLTRSPIEGKHIGFVLESTGLTKGQSVTSTMEYSVNSGRTWAPWSSVTLKSGGFGKTMFVCTPPPRGALIRTIVTSSASGVKAGAVSLLESD